MMVDFIVNYYEIIDYYTQSSNNRPNQLYKYRAPPCLKYTQTFSNTPTLLFSTNIDIIVEVFLAGIILVSKFGSLSHCFVGLLVIQGGANFDKNIDKYPILSQVQPSYLKALLPKAPYHVEPIKTILISVQDCIVAGLTHW